MNVLDKDNLQPYHNSEKYDYIQENYKADLPLILDYAQRIKPDHIIELACGTGRLTIPVAREGYDMTGVDLHQGMLDRAKEKAEAVGLQVDWIQQDCTKLSLQRSASLIFMTGNSFQHFLTNDMQDQLLLSVKQHLHADGYFIFNTRNPLLHDLADVDEYTGSYTDSSGRRVVEENREVYDPITQVQDCLQVRRTFDGETEVETEEISIRIRFTFPLELERMLKQHGYDVEEVYGGWDHEPLRKESIELVVVARRKKADEREA
ncbi:class I SAM-dependent methyltransferase [Jeotgalibacillus sp. R-1-5s-1]|uniref:class I SAM-dependent DNA methyltransferase n=1 Tax=Jeotgalibacillus sp. R-1-5s-1 TaxID=2555897 RepID=UPI00106CFD89|nr:class I SAM-dependent methyltransferase [Jeotgalibacillus sp. R-1-5s-1]TFD94537.1 class I SAM-dependent methyltransferase [Jeotgalibacillus sp. R-1-5s-1]